MHNHVNGHDYCSQADNPQRQQALLEYMLDHNNHHTDELHELGHALEGKASALIHEAVDLFAQGNAKLQLALDELKEH